MADYILMCSVSIQERMKCSQRETQSWLQQRGNENRTGLGASGHPLPFCCNPGSGSGPGLPPHKHPTGSCVLVWVTCSPGSRPSPLVPPGFPHATCWAISPQSPSNTSDIEKFPLSHFISERLSYLIVPLIFYWVLSSFQRGNILSYFYGYLYIFCKHDFFCFF